VTHDALMATLRADPAGPDPRRHAVRCLQAGKLPRPAWPGERSLAVRLELLDFDATLTEDRIESVWQLPWRVWRRPSARACGPEGREAAMATEDTPASA
jgi:hypothetical protein